MLKKIFTPHLIFFSSCVELNLVSIFKFCRVAEIKRPCCISLPRHLENRKDEKQNYNFWSLRSQCLRLTLGTCEKQKKVIVSCTEQEDAADN